MIRAIPVHHPHCNPDCEPGEHWISDDDVDQHAHEKHLRSECAACAPEQEAASAERTRIDVAIEAWENRGPTSLTVSLLADALYGARDKIAELEATLRDRPQRTTAWQDASDEGYRLQVAHAESKITELESVLTAERETSRSLREDAIKELGRMLAGERAKVTAARQLAFGWLYDSDPLRPSLVDTQALLTVLADDAEPEKPDDRHSVMDDEMHVDHPKWPGDAT